MNTQGYFITGTDTEIGKTFISCALLRGFTKRGVRAVGMKPIAAGSDPVGGNEDVRLLRAAGCAADVELINPYLFNEPIAPHIAAEREGVAIEPAHILACYQQLAARHDVVIVEGVGGFCVPLGPGLDTAMLARALGLPVILVVGMRLGCLNHALLTARAIADQGLHLAGWVANCLDPDMLCLAENIAALESRLPAPRLGSVPHTSADHAADSIDLSLLAADARQAQPSNSPPAE